MPLENVTAPVSLPPGVSLCPLLPPGGIFCVAAALVEHRGAPQLVTLRSTVDARVFLASLTDASGAVKEWLELWVQWAGGLDGSAQAHRDLLTNQRLDEGWRRRVEGFRVADAAGLFASGWEESAPGPLFLDPAAKRAVSPADEEGQPLLLCRDDALLAAAALPPYSATLHRYWQSRGPAPRIRCACTPGAPAGSAGVRGWSETYPELARLVALNPEGAPMFLRRFSPLALDDFSDLLGGKPWKGLIESRQPLALEPVYSGFDEWERLLQAGQHFLTGGRSRAALLCELVHLKLRLWIDAAESVRVRVKAAQLPLLNLSDRSFRVELSDPGTPGGLPVFWTARVRPALPGQSLALPIKGTTTRHFLALEAPAFSVYRPQTVSAAVRGSGQVRVRRLAKGTGDETVVEGTLLANERLTAAANDLVWIQFPLSQGRHDLFVTIDYAEGLAKGEARFRSVPQILAPEVAAQFRAAEGVPLSDTPFETIPMLSTPCDLYALGMLGARLFLCNAQTSMGVVADELLSLARQLGVDHDPAIPLAQRVRQVIERDTRLLESLGPHRLLHAALAPAEALQAIPANLWWELVGTLARCLPGLGPDAYCGDFGDVPAAQLEAVFERPLNDMRLLLVRSRSLLLIDWRENREIAGQIQRAFEMSLF